MLEISTSGLMSEGGKRSGLFRVQPPRSSSTLPNLRVAVVSASNCNLGGRSGSIRPQQLGRCGFKRIRSVLTNWSMLPQIVWGGRGRVPKVSVRPV